MNKTTTAMPVWPNFDTITRSMNARNNLMGKLSDDPLLGIQITQEMMQRAMGYERPKS